MKSIHLCYPWVSECRRDIFHMSYLYCEEYPRLRGVNVCLRLSLRFDRGSWKISVESYRRFFPPLSTFPFFPFPSSPQFSSTLSFLQSKQLREIPNQLRFIGYLIKSLAIYWLSAVRSGIFLRCAPLVFLFYTLRANCSMIFSDISSDNREVHGEQLLGKTMVFGRNNKLAKVSKWFR